MEKNISLRVQAYNIIKDKIVNCEYRPGVMINEDTLIAELRLTRTPIRDALGRLEQEGLVEIKPKKGILVTQIKIEEATYLFEARMLYELYAIREYGKFIEKATLVDCYRKLLALQDNRDSGPANALDLQLHTMIMESVPNTYIRSAYDTIIMQIKRLRIRLRILTGVNQQRIEETQKDHMEILTSCIKKDWLAAENALKEHLTKANNSMFDLLIKQLPTTD